LFRRLRHIDSPSQGPLVVLTSVVVVFKNEIDNLKILVPKLLAQDHPNFEIVLCDDFSTDDSFRYVNNLDHPQIKVMQASVDRPGKKLALKEAIKYAKGENILLTDADCYPASNGWIQSMSARLDEKQIVLGYSPHTKKAGWLNKLIRYETFITALQYFSYALAGIPYMGVGRNLMYKKNLFISSTALEESTHLTSGDDDIFVNAVAHDNNTTINLDPKSFVHTYPSSTFAEFLKQKRRHVTTASSYKLPHQLLLGLYALSHVMVYLLFVSGLIIGNAFTITAGFLIVITIKWAIAKRAFNTLECDDLFLSFPILDFSMMLYYVLLSPATFFKTKNW